MFLGSCTGKSQGLCPFFDTTDEICVLNSQTEHRARTSGSGLLAGWMHWGISAPGM